MSLFAGNVSHRASAEEVRAFFAKFGRCRVDVKRGYAFIDYDDDRDAEDARTDTNGKDFHGMKLNVEWSKKHLARTAAGGAPPAADWDRGRRSRYDDRRPRDYDRDYRRRYDAPYDRERYDRDRDYDRRRDVDRSYDRDRDYDRPRHDRDRRDRDRDRDRFDRDGREDRPDGARARHRDRSRSRSRERSYERGRYSQEGDDRAPDDGRDPKENRGREDDQASLGEERNGRQEDELPRDTGVADHDKGETDRGEFENGKGHDGAGEREDRPQPVDAMEKGDRVDGDPERYDDPDASRRRRREDDEREEEAYKRRKMDGDRPDGERTELESHGRDDARMEGEPGHTKEPGNADIAHRDGGAEGNPAPANGQGGEEANGRGDDGAHPAHETDGSGDGEGGVAH